MEFDRERIFVRQAVRGTLESSKASDIRYTLRSYDSRLLYVISGSGTVCADTEVYELSPGSVILFKAGTPYMWNVTEMQFFIINFDYSDRFSHIKGTYHPLHAENFRESDCFDCGTITDRPRLESPIVLKGVQNLEPLFRLAVTEYGVSGEYSEEVTSSAVKTLIYSVLRYESEGRITDMRKGTPLVRNVIDYIGENIGSDISNRSIAEHFHFNASYINRVFKKHTGTTLHEFILVMRIDAAAEKLRSQSTSISEIAKLTGFSGAVHFTKAFRKRMGMTPSEYRNM